MSAMSYEEICADESWRNCGIMHECPRCRCLYEHEIDTRDCPLSDAIDAPLCESCRIDTRGCEGYACAFLTAETGAHHWRCPNREELP